MLEALELLSPTPKCNAKEEQHFLMKPKLLTLSSFFLALSLQPLEKSRKLASPFSFSHHGFQSPPWSKVPEGCSPSAHIRH